MTTSPLLASDAPAETTGKVRRGLFRSPKIAIGLGILAFFALLAIFGPFVAPYNPDRKSVV